jgi:glycosyltransferase 2 family protein
MKLKNILIYILKLVLALGIIAYLIKTEKIDFRSIYNARENYKLIVLAFFFILGAIIINFYRWALLLKGQEIIISAKNIISLSFIGLFFTTILPGAVGGDLIKSVYVAKKSPSKRTASVLTVLLDRIIGVTVLIIIGCIGVFINFEMFKNNAALRTLGSMMILILLGMFFVTILGLSRRVHKSKRVKKLISIIPFSSIIFKIHDAFHAYRKNLRYLVYAFFISFITHILNITAFYCAVRALGFDTLDIKTLFFIVPIGLITTAIPLAPAGLGIGQAAFLKLFEWSLGYPSTIGADAITIVQVLSITIFSAGAYFYLAYKKKNI